MQQNKDAREANLLGNVSITKLLLQSVKEKRYQCGLDHTVIDLKVENRINVLRTAESKFQVF